MRNRAIFWICVAFAAAAGMLVEMLIGGGGRREAWDVSAYWSLGLPILYAVSLMFGLFARRSPLAIGYAPFAGQLVAMLVKTGIGSIIGPGVILLAVIGAGGVAAASLGRAVGRRLG